MKPYFVPALVACALFLATGTARGAELARQGSLWQFGASSFFSAGAFAAAHGPVGSLAAADLGGDGIAELLLAAGRSAEPRVRALRGDGSEIFSFLAFDAKYRGGVRATTGDIDGDASREIIVATGGGAKGEVRIFAGDIAKPGTKPLFPYGTGYTGGISVAAADLDGDGKAEIVTAPETGSAAVAVWKADGTKVGSVTVFGSAKGGARVAVGDVDGDGKNEIVAVTAGGASRIAVVDGQQLKVRSEFAAISPNFRGGLQVGLIDAERDGASEIVVAPAGAGGPHVHAYRADGGLFTHFFAGHEPYRGGTLLASGAIGQARALTLVTLATEPEGVRPDMAKYIQVDLSEQRLRAYERGALVQTFLVSTGKPATPTPKGEFPISAKPYIVRYAGPGYDLGNVPFNLRFFPHIYIHYAPWHSNFGSVMSRGCVNVDRASAEWIYAWGEVGTPVAVVD